MDGCGVKVAGPGSSPGEFVERMSQKGVILSFPVSSTYCLSPVPLGMKDFFYYIGNLHLPMHYPDEQNVSG